VANTSSFSLLPPVQILAFAMLRLIRSDSMRQDMLLFKKKFLDAIRQGTKTQTIRLWTHRMMRAGQRSYIPGAGYIRIESVEQVALEDLTEEDAMRDGFDSLTALKEEIASIYESTAAGKKPFRVRFVLLPPEEQHKRRS
jgi:hypothetical protein